MVRKTPGSEIQVEAFIEVADLFSLNAVLVYLFDDGAASRCVISAAGPLSQFDNLTTIVCAGEFIRGRHPGNAGAKDHDRLTATRSLRQFRRTGPHFRKMNQSQRRHS